MTRHETFATKSISEKDMVLATDLDGTFWATDMTVHETTLDVVRQLDDAGIPLLVATGRRAQGTLAGLVPAGLGDRPAIMMNGALARDRVEGPSFLTESIAVNGFTRREAETTVQMRDGESFAIAGLLQDDFRNLKGQVPWLGDVPVLGALFRSADYEREQSELVIIVTPHLVTPTRGEALALPTDRIRIPSEREFFLNGKMVGARTPKTGAAGEVARQDFSGSYGYVME